MTPRTFLLALLLALTLAPAAWAQDAADGLDPGAVGFGGPWVGWLDLDLAELNEPLAANGYDAFPDGMLLFGGGGSGGSLSGLRFGGGGGGGDVSTRRDGRIARLSVGYGGVWLDYGLVGTERFDLSVGAILGGGAAELELVRGLPQDFEDAIATPITTKMERGFFAAQPMAGLSVGLSPWLSLRVSGGYLVTFGSGWTVEGQEFNGPPAPFAGWTVQVGLAFGGRSADDEDDE